MFEIDPKLVEKLVSSQSIGGALFGLLLAWIKAHTKKSKKEREDAISAIKSAAEAKIKENEEKTDNKIREAEHRNRIETMIADLSRDTKDLSSCVEKHAEAQTNFKGASEKAFRHLFHRVHYLESNLLSEELYEKIPKDKDH